MRCLEGSFYGRYGSRRCALKRVRLAADRHRAGLHNPDHLLLVEIDDREEPFDRAAPDILCAGGVEARHSDEAPALLARIAAGPSGQWRAQQLRPLDRHLAAPLDRRAAVRTD